MYFVFKFMLKAPLCRRLGIMKNNICHDCFSEEGNEMIQVDVQVHLPIIYKDHNCNQIGKK